MKLVCIDEPHWRSTVVPHTDSGQPATIGTIRPMFQPWLPDLSHTAEPDVLDLGRIDVLPLDERVQNRPASSSPRIEDSVPFRLPIGERTASTIAPLISS